MNFAKQGFLLIILILGGLTSEVNGQCTFASSIDCPNTIISAVPFLRIIPDARSAAMGDAGIAVSADANSMHHNASKLAFIDQSIGLSASYSPWLRDLGLQDVYLAYLSGFKKIDDNQTIGMSLRYFALGEINFTTADGDPAGTGRPNEFEVAVAYARKLSEKFSAALTGKFIYSNLAGGQTVNSLDIVPGIAGAADISFTYVTPMNIGAGSDLRIGLVVSNLGSKISYTKSETKDFIPANLGLGAALDMDFDDYNRLTFTLDFNKLLVPTPDTIDSNPRNDIPDFREKGFFSGVLGSFGDAPGGFKEELREVSISFGAEYWYANQFAIRAGYYYEHATKGNRQFLTAGIGIKYNIFGMNLSYLIPTSQQRSPLDNTLRFSLIFDFDAAQPAATIQ